MDVILREKPLPRSATVTGALWCLREVGVLILVTTYVGQSRVLIENSWTPKGSTTTSIVWLGIESSLSFKSSGPFCFSVI